MRAKTGEEDQNARSDSFILIHDTFETAKSFMVLVLESEVHKIVDLLIKINKMI